MEHWYTGIASRSSKRKPAKKQGLKPFQKNMDDQYTLYWNNYLGHITDAFGSLQDNEDLVDVTLSCERKTLKAHKILLSACSSYFRDIFKENPCQHPVIVFRNVKCKNLEAIIHFMYKGEVNVSQDEIQSFLELAQLLEVQGLEVGPENYTYEDKRQLPSQLETPTVVKRMQRRLPSQSKTMQRQLPLQLKTPTVLKTKVKSSPSTSTSSFIPSWTKRNIHEAEEIPKCNETPYKKLKIGRRQTDEDDFGTESADEVDVCGGETEESEVSVKKVLTEMSTQFGSDERLDDSFHNAESENFG